MRRNRNPDNGRAVCTMGTILLAVAAAAPATGQNGEETYRTFCVACHTVGGGRLVGPDLAGVTERRSEDWLIRFVQRSQSVIASGDPEAEALSQEYPGLIMPDWPLSDDEVRAVLDYIRGAAATAGAAQAAPATPQAFTPEQMELGRHLFQGTTRFVQGGPACNSCHEVAHDAVIGGGILAKDLTTVFTRLGGAGVRAIVGSPPFPVMERAYRNHPLSEEEQVAVLAFLQRADAEQAFQQPRDYGVRLLQAGILGTVLLLGLYTLVWRNRRRGSVNRAIFARQVRSA